VEEWHVLLERWKFQKLIHVYLGKLRTLAMEKMELQVKTLIEKLSIINK
jgi:hypothetical protein